MADTTNDYVTVPRGIDDPPILLFARVDEILPFLVGIVIGFMVGQLMLCMVVGLVATKYFKRFNTNSPDGLPLHILYWLGYINSKGWSFLNPFIRRFYP